MKPSDFENKEKTVSAELRKFIIERFLEDTSYERIFYLAYASVALKQQGRTLRYASYSKPIMDFFVSLFNHQYDVELKSVKRKEMYIFTVSDRHLVNIINSDLEHFFHHNPAQIAENATPEQYYAMVKWILSGLFLGCGSLADPAERYNLEFAIPKRSASLWYGLFLSEIQLEPGRVVHQGSEILYLKDSDKISDFLRYISADKLLLEFEQIRVKKEMRNRVNRIVNCDSANAQRMANSAARQINNINWLKQNTDWEQLPQEIQATANLRLAFPAYSLKDLGEEANPPIGKSGMNHRLQKIDKLVEKLKKAKKDSVD